MSTYLRSSCLGDFKCPHCGVELEWNDDTLYSFNREKVICGSCDRVFYVKRIEVIKYEVTK